MAHIESITLGEIYKLKTKVMAENDILSIGKKEIAKIFLQNLLELLPETNYAEVELSYKFLFSEEDLPENSHDFWVFIEKKYLSFDKEPKDIFTELSFQVSQDLEEIAENLNYISTQRERTAEKKTNGKLPAKEHYYQLQLDYFERKNIIARDQIVKFMTKDIKHYAIKKATKKLHEDFLALLPFRDSPYPFGRKFVFSFNPYNSYDVRSCDEYSNKFTDLPVRHYKQIVNKCRKSPEHFKEIAHAYITGIPDNLPSVRKKISDLIDKSHVLARRKQVILTMLKHFENQDYISFVSIAPLQIEGIFADICQEVEISAKQLDISSLNSKLEHIDKKMNSFSYFEYYAFIFPVMRNLVAHGELIDGDFEETAVRLILDLLPVCELASSKDLPINHALIVLGEASKSNYEKLAEWLMLRDKVKIPDFYNAEEKIASTEALYASDGFWEYLRGKLKSLRSVDDIKGSEALKLASIVKKSDLATEQANTFLKSANRIATETINERNKTVELFRQSIGLSKQD